MYTNVLKHTLTIYCFLLYYNQYYTVWLIFACVTTEVQSKREQLLQGRQSKYYCQRTLWKTHFINLSYKPHYCGFLVPKEKPNYWKCGVIFLSLRDYQPIRNSEFVLYNSILDVSNWIWNSLYQKRDALVKLIISGLRVLR